MLDFRHETFYELCRIGSYTKTAEFLHLTQPAVSQHIRHLEQIYGGPLFVYSGRRLALTRRGLKLYQYVQVLRSDSNKVVSELKEMDLEPQELSFGATLTIGEYVMPGILRQMIERFPQYNISMAVGNTQTLLSKLDNGEIAFTVLEGYFDKSLYTSRLLSQETFIAICAPDSPLAGKKIPFDELTGHRLILREHGSGTREIFEKALEEHHYSLGSFQQICEIANMHAIKELVGYGVGISFMYQQAASAELKKGSLAEFFIEDFSASHPFHFVCAKDSVYQQQYLKWFDIIYSLSNSTITTSPAG